MEAEPLNHMNLGKATWKKSSRSADNGGNCVEVATNLPGVVALRDSKNVDGAVLTFGVDEWRTFLGRLKDQGSGRA
jgi:hypothetical protein